jgi:hypothetical protein
MSDPRKWSSKKQYVRIESHSGLPQLIRIEPAVTEEGRIIPNKVALFIDDDMTIVSRESAEEFINEMNCVPIEKLQQGPPKANG